jgi:hypothetical protein
MPACWLPRWQAGQPAGCQGGRQASLLAAKEAGMSTWWVPRTEASQPITHKIVTPFILKYVKLHHTSHIFSAESAY